MKITTIASYLVHPGKNQEHPQEAQGTTLPLSGNLYDMLNEVFLKSEKECRVPIRFVMAKDGTQQNEVRNHILSFLRSPDLEAGRILANRLRDYSTRRSGLGLLFLILGCDDTSQKVVLSRFPADQGILAEEGRDALRVEFIERVFMRSATTYKAALYQGSSYDANFWSGFAVDKQINAANDQIANYWIRDFLSSDFLTTSKAGTRRLAIALRKASRAASLETRGEIVAATILTKGLFGQPLSAREFMDRLGLSPYAKSAIMSELPNEKLIDDTFLLDEDEFRRHATFASVELHTGGILIAPVDRFNECFPRKVIDKENNEYRFTAIGRIVDERLKGRIL